MKFGCEFCKREFLRESTIMKHMCETKDRWLSKDKQGNRIGFQAWVQFYKKNTASKKQKTYEEFVKSAYYIAFVKFGNYCVNVNTINVSRFVDWLLKNQIKIDNWCSDTTLIREFNSKDVKKIIVNYVQVKRRDTIGYIYVTVQKRFRKDEEYLYFESMDE